MKKIKIILSKQEADDLLQDLIEIDVHDYYPASMMSLLEDLNEKLYGKGLVQK